jgi:hypothetical protein
MEEILSFVPSWKGQFDTTNLYQVTSIRHQYPHQFIPIYYPIHRNTGIHVHDVLINRKNENMLHELMELDASLDEKQSMFSQLYTHPPYSIDIRYRHGY